MPSSGPGRQGTIRRNSLKKKKKKDGGGFFGSSPSPTPASVATASSQQAVVPVSSNIEEHRASLAVDGDSINNDFIAMQQMGDQVDEYYYGLRIFPGQGSAKSFLCMDSTIFVMLLVTVICLFPSPLP